MYGRFGFGGMGGFAPPVGYPGGGGYPGHAPQHPGVNAPRGVGGGRGSVYYPPPPPARGPQGYQPYQPYGAQQQQQQQQQAPSSTTAGGGAYHQHQHQQQQQQRQRTPSTGVAQPYQQQQQYQQPQQYQQSNNTNTNNNNNNNNNNNQQHQQKPHTQPQYQSPSSRGTQVQTVEAAARKTFESPTHTDGHPFRRPSRESREGTQFVTQDPPTPPQDKQQRGSRSRIPASPVSARKLAKEGISHDSAVSPATPSKARSQASAGSGNRRAQSPFSRRSSSRSSRSEQRASAQNQQSGAQQPNALPRVQQEAQAPPRQFSASSLPPATRGRFEDYYAAQTQIGMGTSATVLRCTHKKSGKEYAVKVVKRSHWANHPERLDSILREIAIMTQCDHPNVLSVYEWFRTPDSLHIITELARGGDLLDRLEETGPLPVATASRIMRQIVSALHYLHERGVVHRDLKPENILLLDKSGSDVVRLCDFGTAACLADPPQRGGNILATYEYVAPEVLRKSSQQKRQGQQLGQQQPQVVSYPCDMWSAGVILFICATGLFPFDPTEASICSGEYEFPPGSQVNPAVQDLISRLLVVDQGKRARAEEALKHGFCAAGDR